MNFATAQFRLGLCPRQLAAGPLLLADKINRLVYGWLACWRLAGQMSHPADAAHFRQRQKEIRREIKKLCQSLPL